MGKLPRISDAEWEVMKVVWEHSPITANEVVEALRPHVSWNPRTIKTLINRLVAKQALGYQAEGRMYRYYPKVAEAECIKAESRSFIDRVYGGALTPLLLNFLEEKALRPEEIEALRRILESRGEK